MQRTRNRAGRTSATARSRALRDACALGLYVVLAAAIFGRGVLEHLDSTLVGSGQSPAFAGRDQGAFVWFLAWGAHVMAHPQNPLVTHQVYAPGGYNLAWAASIPGPSLLLAPLTAELGAVRMFNLVALLAPAFAAWTAYLLCARVCGRRVPAFVGGLLFGFGTYETSQTVNHLNLALVALVPLVPMLALGRFRCRGSARRYVIGLALVLAAQLWTSTEMFADLIVFSSLGLTVVFLLSRDDVRGAVAKLGVESLVALGLALLLGAPILLAATGPDPVGSHSVVNAGADVANALIPTRVTWLHGLVGGASETSLGGNLSEETAYIGPLLLLVLVAFAVQARRSRLARGALLFTCCAFVLSLGGRLIALGEPTHVMLPWALIGQLPPLRYALPDRFAVFTWLGIALSVTLFLSQGRFRWLRWLTVAAACLSVMPSVSGFPWSTRLDTPALTSQGALARYVHPGSTVLALPFGMDGASMLWQVESQFAFRLAGGYVSWALPAQYRGLTIIRELTGRPPGGQLRRRLCGFLELTHAETILLRDGARGDWKADLAPLHISPKDVGGFLVYARPQSACAGHA